MNTVSSSWRNILRNAVGAILILVSMCFTQGQGLLDTTDYKEYIIKFNSMDPETIVKAIPNAKAWDWMKKNIPFFEYSSAKIEEIYYYRWWTYRKHIIKQEGYSGYVLTEFNN